jgi:hypothetical protein
MPMMAATVVSAWMGAGNAQKWHAQRQMWHEMPEQTNLSKKKKMPVNPVKPMRGLHLVFILTQDNS